VGCSGGCGGCVDGSSSSEKSCGGSCDGSCDCKDKLDKARHRAMKDNGMRCSLCNGFTMYAEPNVCDGRFFCYKCRSDKSWKIGKVNWL